MELSARNQITGTVKSVTHGAVMTEVVVEIPGGTEIASTITKASAERLGVDVGKQVVVVIKSTDVMLGTM